jgi:hypoxanthine phosphoribosyltransferase
MAAEIIARYKSTDTIFVSLLNGSQPFASKLMFAIAKHNPEFHPNVQSMIISRYGKSRTGGEASVVTDLPPGYRDLTGKQAVLIDDLVDGGGTLEFAAKHLKSYGATKVGSIVLIKKVKDPPVTVNLAIYGFEAPDVWLTGMGMDDERLAPEGNRWAGWIAEAND